jgi:DNA-binding SARP family transcriptional activator
MLKIYTLGGFNVQQSTQTSVQDDVPAVDPEEQPITGFISRKVEALLVYLAIERREHPREVLAELLWQDAPQARAMANLRMALSNLQQLIAPYLLVSRQTVSLNPDSEIWLDVAQLESAIDATETHWMRGLPKHVLTRLEKGLDLYRGDFLVGFQLKDSRSFDGWRTLEQERLRGRMIETSHQLASYMMERKMFAAGLQHGTRLLQLDPSWEEAHQMMMIMLAKSGQRNLALAQYETCRRILREELDVEPDERTTEIYEQILAEKILPATINVPPHNLPALATPFVRRHIELSQLAERLDEPNCRLLTLVGPGGMGKTRIALQAAMDRVNDFRNGIFFIPLAEIHSPEYVVAAINSNLSETLKVTLTDKNGLIDYLREKEMLLVMDNFEHVLESADLISEILRAAPAIKVLVTSREQLNLQEEWILPIEGMAFPRSVKAVGADVFGAVQLFVQAAQRVRPTFSLSEQSQEVIRICQLVEGMPLGLELAASWVRTMSCAEIAQQIQSDLDFLETSRRNMPERHRSIRALFEQAGVRLPTTNARHLCGFPHSKAHST